MNSSNLYFYKFLQGSPPVAGRDNIGDQNASKSNASCVNLQGISHAESGVVNSLESCRKLPASFDFQPERVADEFSNPVKSVRAGKQVERQQVGSCQDQAFISNMLNLIQPDLPKIFEPGNELTGLENQDGVVSKQIEKSDSIVGGDAIVEGGVNQRKDKPDGNQFRDYQLMIVWVRPTWARKGLLGSCPARHRLMVEFLQRLWKQAMGLRLWAGFYLLVRKGFWLLLPFKIPTLFLLVHSGGRLESILVGVLRLLLSLL